MSFLFRNHRNKKALSFNITPVIDIIFLLIVFFVLDFQFFGNDSDNVELPDKCDFAKPCQQALPDAAAVVVTETEFGKIQYSVNNQKMDSVNHQLLVQQMTTTIDNRIKDLPKESRIVILRIDRNLDFSNARYAIDAVSASTATKIKIATLAKDRTD